jgi:PBP1b-binding outer membrane lipoprotein LpoB
MKSLATKLFAVIFIIILAAGCASSITAPQDIQAEEEVTQTEAPANPDDITGGTDMEGSRSESDPYEL